MQRGSPLCPRTCSWQHASGGRSSHAGMSCCCDCGSSRSSNSSGHQHLQRPSRRPTHAECQLLTGGRRSTADWCAGGSSGVRASTCCRLGLCMTAAASSLVAVTAFASSCTCSWHVLCVTAAAAGRIAVESTLVVSWVVLYVECVVTAAAAAVSGHAAPCLRVWASISLCVKASTCGGSFVDAAVAPAAVAVRMV